jgi:site-specific recombinase XerD
MAGLEKRVHPHGLRHTHAAELAREGVPINVIRDQLGHSSLAVTDRYLRDVAPADLIALGKSPHLDGRRPVSGVPVQRGGPVLGLGRADLG